MMKSFNMLDDKQRSAIRDWRQRVHIDNSILTANNFVALLDFITEKDRHWQSLQSPVNMNVLNNS